MPLDKQLLRRIEQRERRLEEMTPEACLATATLLRDVKPRLTSARQRELAQEMAESFEAQAAEASRLASS